jgi:hypothetical protein
LQLRHEIIKFKHGLAFEVQWSVLNEDPMQEKEGGARYAGIVTKHCTHQYVSVTLTALP